MNVYDFDGTIYRRDSTVGFYLFCLKKRPVLLRFCFRQGLGVLAYMLRLKTKTRAKEIFLSFLRGVPDPAAYASAYWDANLSGIMPWYLERKKPDDVIISASPDFIVRPACERLGIGHLIATTVDPHTGEFLSENNRGEEKVRRFKAEFGNAPIEHFYSDSLSDAPMARLAAHSFFVRGELLYPWEEIPLQR